MSLRMMNDQMGSQVNGYAVVGFVLDFGLIIFEGSRYLVVVYILMIVYQDEEFAIGAIPWRPGS